MNSLLLFFYKSLVGTFILSLSCVCVSSAETKAPNASGGSTNLASFDLAGTQAAAEKGDPKALFELARAYNRGTSLPKDLAKAFQYTRQAAEKGYAPAETALGSFYGRGIEVPKDLTEAIRWYRKAADHGYAMAQYALAGFYKSGTGVP